jgi:hypothetical protein
MHPYGKIISRMFAPQIDDKVAPPRIIPSIVEGFNAIAGRVYLILFPVLLDLFLWFGPLVRVKKLLMPTLTRATELSAGAYGEGADAIIQHSNELWTELLEGFNLFFALRTYPVGITSLMVSQDKSTNPLGSPLILEMNSARGALLVLILLTLLGIVLGSLYFSLVARSTDKKLSALSIPVFLRLSSQSIILTLLLVVLLSVLGLPAMCFISSIMLFLPSLGTLPFMIFGLMAVWVMMPLVFTPHGIFMGEMKTQRSIVTSIKFVRASMAGTGIFFICVILIGYGLDMLWSTPGAESWMMLVGIIGHGFISSGLLAASFVFYRDGLAWLSEVVRAKEIQKARQADL